MKESDAEKGIKKLRSEFPKWKVGKKTDGKNFAIVAWANEKDVFVIMGGLEEPLVKDDAKFCVGFNSKGGEASSWSNPALFDTIYDAVEFVIELGRKL
jgi:hypothetical protein